MSHQVPSPSPLAAPVTRPGWLRQQQGLTQGWWETSGADLATSPCPGCTAKVTSWSVEEQGLFSGFKKGNYFSARPSQASSTPHTI